MHKQKRREKGKRNTDRLVGLGTCAVVFLVLHHLDARNRLSMMTGRMQCVCHRSFLVNNCVSIRREREGEEQRHRCTLSIICRHRRLLDRTVMSKSSSRPNDFFDLPEEARADDQYVVEKILAKRRTRKGKWEYLLKWAGCKRREIECAAARLTHAVVF